MTENHKLAIKRNKKLALLDTVNVKNFNIPNEIQYESVLNYAHESIGECAAFPELSKFKIDKDEEIWKKRLKKGKLISINDPEIGGITNIMDSWTDIRECIGWKLVRIENNILNKTICPSIVVKKKNGKFYFLDGRTRACLFHVFKLKNQMIWLLDLKEDEEDYILKLKHTDDKVKYVFDYGNIKEEHQAIARDIVEKMNKGLHGENLKKELIYLFKLEKEEEYDIENNVFSNYAKKAQLNVNKQGYISTKSDDGKIKNYPVIAVCDDIRKFDKMIELIYKDFMIIKKNESK
jgi:hypothetical protein